MTKTTIEQAKSGSEIYVPLNRLKKSPKNVRKVPHGEADIAALAASIGANGLLQNLVVEQEVKQGKPTGHYLVTVGEGRRLALMQRAKHKEIGNAEPVRCVLGESAAAHEASLAENVIRTAMHPADEYDAFAALHQDKGMAAEDIAARFGVSVAVVRQRLRLGAVSPALMQAYRAGDLTLEQMMAFTLTDDHARQEEVVSALGWDRSAHTIRRMLTEGQVATDDRRVRFVGIEAYGEAGGIITRDLFDEEGGGYLADAALLDRLVTAKLEQEAQAVRGEGWAWVTVSPEYDHRLTADMRRVYPVPVTVTAKAQRKLDKLSDQYDELVAEIDMDGVTDEREARLRELDAAIEALQPKPVFAAEDIARSGAMVSVGYNGELRIERGYIRKEDAAPATAEGGETGPDAKAVKSAKLPDRLVAQLTAHRTLALREAVANRPDIAFVAVVHALAVATFYPGGRVSCLEIKAGSAILAGHAPGIDESPLGRAAAEREEALGASLPQNPDDLWEFLVALPQERLMALLAHCAAATIDSVVQPKQSSSPSMTHVGALAQAVSLDMAEHWKPTVSSYFGHVTKDTILAAVREGVSDDAAQRLVHLKKTPMAEAAEQLLAGKRWLPNIVRLSRPNQDAITIP